MTIDAIDAIVADAIARRVFPGAVVAVARGAAMLHCAAYGATEYDGQGAPVNCATIYDVASLTKVFTATAALRLYEAGQLEFGAPAREYLPQFSAPEITLHHLLTHTSGLDLRLSALRHAGRAGLLDAVYRTQPKSPPGSRVAYTNINSLLLGEIVAAVYGKPLDAALDELVIAPLGLRETGYRPAARLAARIAPTEFDLEWRGRLVHGSVHDESAHALGGVAGHAGLFSTALDLLTFCQSWMPDAPPTLLRAATIRLATTNQTPELTPACGLGWMMNRANFMGGAPPGTFGHTGFTGPALILEPSRAISIVIVSNRVYPRRDTPRHHEVTAAIVAAALDAR